MFWLYIILGFLGIMLLLGGFMYLVMLAMNFKSR